MSTTAVKSAPDAPPPVKPLKPETLDDLAAEYLAIGLEVDEAETALAEKFKAKVERMGELRVQLTAACAAYGSPHEKKSKLLSGLAYEVMTTESSTSSVDQAAIAVFLKKCEKADKLSLFEELFEKVSEYRIRPSAPEVVRRTLGNKLTDAMAGLFLKCTVSKTNPPRLTAVRLRKKATA